MAYTKEQKKTLRAIRSAFKSKTLAEPGGCRYVTDEGKHCIVGTVLHNYGFSDDILEFGLPDYYNSLGTKPNDVSIRKRNDILPLITKKGLDIQLLREAQSTFDLGLRGDLWLRGEDIQTKIINSI